MRRPETEALPIYRQGLRFGNENLGYSGFGALVMAQGNEAYAIYDTRIREYVAHYQQTYQVLVDMGGAKDAPAIEDLARTISTPAHWPGRSRNSIVPHAMSCPMNSGVRNSGLRRSRRRT